MQQNQNLLSLKSDWVFKRIFGKEGNEDILADLLSAILDIEINKIELRNTELLKNREEQKKSILDIKEYFDKKEVVPSAMNERMMNLFKEYIVVGGMPRVVNDFVQNHNFANVLKIQKAIISDYEDDIAKYAEGAEKAKARACFLSIPKHLSKDYKKSENVMHVSFQYLQSYKTFLQSD